MIAAPVISIRTNKVRLNRRVHLRAIEGERAKALRRNKKRRLQAKKRAAYEARQ